MPICPGCERRVPYDRMGIHERYCEEIDRGAAGLGERVEALNRRLRAVENRLDRRLRRLESDLERRVTELEQGLNDTAAADEAS